MLRAVSRRRLIRASAGLSALALASPRLAFAAEGDRLKIRSDTDIQVLDPAFEIGGPEEVVNDAIFVTLTSYKGDGSSDWELYAASSLEQVDPLTIAFTLRDDLSWSDGLGPVTAEDVKFSFERIVDPKMESPWADYWGPLDRVEVVDALSGRIVFKEPFSPVWAVFPRYVGRIVPKKGVEAAGGRFTTEPPAICGPYRIANWTPKQRVLLARNPEWKGATPQFDEIEIFIIQDTKSAELAYEAGEIDFTDVSVDSIKRYRERPPENATLLELPGLNYIWLGINTEHPRFGDIRVRQAIQHAIDVDAILAGAYGGIPSRANGCVPPSLLGSRSRNLIAERDVEKARQLLAEAGLADGFATTLAIMNESIYATAAQIIQASLAEVGISVEIIPYESGTYWNLGLESEGEDWKDLQLVLQRFTISPDPSSCTTWFTSEQAGKWNWQRYRNEEFDRLHKAAHTEQDPQRRHDMYVRMQDIMEESGAYVFIAHEPAAAIHDADLRPAVRPDFALMVRETRRG